jgi:hypothetical protein
VQVGGKLRFMYVGQEHPVSPPRRHRASVP